MLWVKRIMTSALAVSAIGFCHAEKLIVEIINGVDSLPVSGVNITTIIPGNDPFEFVAEGNVFTQIFKGNVIAIEFKHKDYYTLKKEFKLTQPEEKSVVVLEPKSKTLGEIVVTSELLKVYADRDEIYLTKENKNFGTSAIDAISSLPQFLPTINGGSLKTISGKDIQIIIDGRVASNQELINLKGSRISKVILYKNPPAKYAGRVAGEVVEVFLVRPKDVSVEGNVRAISSLTFPQLIANAGLNLIDQINYGGVLYSGLFKNVFEVSDVRNVYNYTDAVSTLCSEDSHSRDFSNTVSAFYQYNNNRNMLYVNYEYFQDSALERFNYKLDEKFLTDNNEGKSYSLGTVRREQHKANLYYSKDFVSGSELYADIVCTWQNNRKHNIFMQNPEENSNYQSFYSETESKSKNYSFIGAIGYIMPLKNGSLTFSEYLNYYQFRQDYYFDLEKMGYVRNTPEMIDNIFYVGYNFNKNRFSLNTNIGIVSTSYKVEKENKSTNIIPTARFNISYRFSNSFTLRAGGNISLTKPATSELNDNILVIDSRYFVINNSYLRNSTKYSSSLNTVITLPGNKFVIQPDVNYYFERHPIMSNIFYDAGLAYRQRINLKYSNSLEYGTSVSWRATNMLMLSGNIRAFHLAYKIKGQNVRFNSLTGSASVMIFFTNFSGNLTFYAPSVRMNGVVRSKYPGFVAVESNYGIKNWNFGLKYQYTIGNNKTTADVEGFAMSNIVSNGKYRNFVSASVSYRFNIGKYFSKKQKSVYNSERDSGL